MHLDIEDSSLESLLQNYKDYIGESWVNGVVNIIGGCSFQQYPDWDEDEFDEE